MKYLTSGSFKEDNKKPYIINGTNATKHILAVLDTNPNEKRNSYIRYYDLCIVSAR